jgi:hypothetical protein
MGAHPPIPNMTIPSQAIMRSLLPGQTVELRRSDGTPAQSAMPYEHVEHLAKAGAIIAKATSAGTIRFLILTVSDPEADLAISLGCARSGGSVPGRIETQASRTTIHETIHGKHKTFKSWRHFRQQAFADGALRLHSMASHAEAVTL